MLNHNITITDRKLSTLYRILLRETSNVRIRKVGICKCITDLYKHNLISLDDYEKLKIHFEKQTPNEMNHKKFYYKRFGSAYWWKCESQFTEALHRYASIPKAPLTIRVDFIKYLIDICKKDEKD